MSDIRAIDYWCNLFTEPGIEAHRTSESIQFVKELFDMPELYAEGSEKTADEFIDDLDSAGVETVLIPSIKIGDPRGYIDVDVHVEDVREVCERYPTRFKGLFGIDPNHGMDAVRAFERTVREDDFVGAHLHPFGWELPVNHRRYYPYYTKCVELDVPVVMQIGHSAELMPNRTGKPILLDDVALDFPELKIIAAHTGWPWVEELVSLGWKHPNLYIGTTAHAPKYWDDDLVDFLVSRGRDKVMFGTDYPVLDHDDALAQIEEYHEFDDDVKRRLLRENAMNVFDL